MKSFYFNRFSYCIAVFFSFIIYQGKSQNIEGIPITATKVIDDSERRESPASVLIWDANLEKNQVGSYTFITKTPIAFTSFGIGFKADDTKSPAGSFTVKFRVKKEGESWSGFYEEDAYVHPSETPTELYFTDLLFPPTEDAYHYIEFFISAPKNVNLTQVRLDLIDIRNTGKPGPTPQDEGMFYKDYKSCPAFPAKIPRSEWCGAYSACHNPTYTPTIINATHAVIHHGASPDHYTDGYAVVRSYWNYHVNTLGWADIGYNYLFDKYGNFFHGRHNPNAPNSDVRAAHAGSSNSVSIGINFLGNSDATLPTSPQLNKNNEFLAWWFDHKGLDPTTSASMILQNGSTGVRPRICGHRDVHATACPGDALYAELPEIRTNTKAIIDNCYNTQPPTTSISIPSNNSWVNNDFTAYFDDVGNGSEIARRFYQVLEFDGNYWGANYHNGFFGDNFVNLTTNPWIISTGNWNLNNGVLIQSDQNEGNTNIYAPLDQTLSNRYLYQFYAKAEGSDSNRRFGFHFFADDGSQSNRGNSYFIWFRVDGQSLQFYKVSNNTFSLEKTINDITTNPGQWYDFKVIYDRITGEILVYRDDVYLGSWTDPSPYSNNGNYISFRTGNTQLHVAEIKVYRTRNPEVTVKVGDENDNDIRYQSVNSDTPAGKVKSIVSDQANNLSEIAHFDIYVDQEIPLTDINLSFEGQWATENFTAIFNDNDNVSGIDRKFYHVGEHNGNHWSANTNRGFFYDGFEQLDTDLYTIASGTWNASNGELIQSDESVNNTNIYAPLNQTLSNRYMYHFNAKVDGPEHANGRRFGMHFFSDNGSLTNRGNSYFIFFRVESQRLEFYKVTNNIFSQVKVIDDINTVPGQYYDFKVIYDRITGEIIVYRDDVFLGSWTDDSPFAQNGNYISFRTGNSHLYLKDISVYRTRFPEANILIGEDNTKDIRTQSLNNETPGGRIKSIVSDQAGNLSGIFAEEFLVDRTPPSAVAFVNDGLEDDISETNTLSELSANWGDAGDDNSGILRYWYAIGSQAGNTDVVDWTDNSLNTVITHDGLSLTSGETYYFSIRAENGAGLIGNVVSSTGQTAVTGPTNLQHTLHGCPNNEVTFSWENSGTGWYIQLSEYPNFSEPYWKFVSGLNSWTGPHGFELQADGSPLEFTGGNTYYWRIRAEGEWTSSLNFTLPVCICDPITEFPYFNNFNSGEAFCWEIESNSSTTWSQIESFTVVETTIEPVSGTHFFRCHWSDIEAQNEWLISPVFDFTDITPELSFYFNGSYHWSVTNPNSDLDLLVKVNNGEWTHIWNNKDHQEFTSNDINYVWLLAEFELPQYANMKEVQFAFNYNGFDGAAFSVDNITVSGQEIQLLAGDINGDNIINVLDIVWLVNHLNGITPEGFLYHNADLTGTGDIGVSDLTSLVNLLMEVEKNINDTITESEPAHMYLDKDGLVRFVSDATLLAIQFELISDSLHNFELELLFNEQYGTNHKLSFNKVTGKGVIYSLSNMIIPGNEIQLFFISGEGIETIKWGDAYASNINHDLVDIYTYNAFDEDDDTDDQDEDTDITEIFNVYSSNINDVSIFPNPNTGNFKIKINLQEASYLQLQLIDINGRIISSSEIKYLTEGEHSIDYSVDNSSGLNILKIFQFDQSWKSPFIIHEEKIMIIKH